MRATATFEAASAVSDAVSLSAVVPAPSAGFPPIPVQFFSPDGLDADVAALAFLTSADGETFKPLYNKDGRVSVPIADGQNACVEISTLAGCRVFQLELLDADGEPVEVAEERIFVIGFTL